MQPFASLADSKAIEAECSWLDRGLPRTMAAFLNDVAGRHGDRPAVSFQLLSDPGSRADTLTWSELRDQAMQAANLFRSMGIGKDDVVALLLPNCLDMAVAMLGASIAGIASPINPLLEPEQIASILRETDARVLVTLKSFPKAEVAQKAANAVRHAPRVHTVLEVDLLHHLAPPKSWLVPLLRPKNPDARRHHAEIKGFRAEMSAHPKTLSFDDPPENRVGALFHTGGTTGMPKVARHYYQGMIYNGWIGHTLMFGHDDVVMCPLPMFHVFATEVVLMSMIASGGHAVFPTPAGYRGDGVFDNFWKLIEQWKATFIIAVPTAISALMQRPINADVSSIKNAFSGSAPLPVELYKRFEAATGVAIIEGYGLTEATCLVSCNPKIGEKKIGSVGIPFPYSDVKIMRDTPDGPQPCATDEVGEICVSSPGVVPGMTYTEGEKNAKLFHGAYLRTGDLGRLDPDGYVWITGRAKDLIIRGGHNIDPAEIEDALAAHPQVAMAGAIGQPDAHAGELPCVYVELVQDATVTVDELIAWARRHVHERAAVPKHVEILPELPKTAVGKVFKPALRGRAITRVYDVALADAGLPVRVDAVIEDSKLGLVAHLVRDGECDDAPVAECLGRFTRPWIWAEDAVKAPAD